MFDRVLPEMPASPPLSPPAAPAQRALLLDAGALTFLKGIAHVVATTFDMAHVAISLTDGQTIGAKTICGPDTSLEGYCPECPLRGAQRVAPLVIRDPRADARLAHTRLVQECGLRFYAGVALQAGDGRRLGNLCLKDRRPRAFDPRQVATLQQFGALISGYMQSSTESLRGLEQAALLRGYLDVALAGVLAFRPVRDAAAQVVDFEVVLTNPLADRLLGRGAPTLLGHCMLEDFPELWETGVFQRCVDVLATGQPITFEERLLHDDIDAWVHVVAVRVNAERLAVTLTDITARKLSEDRRRDHLSFLNTMLDTISAPVFYKDRAGRYLGCNAAFEQLVGRPRDQLIGRHARDLFPADVADHYQRVDEELFAQPGRQACESPLFSAADGLHDMLAYKATFHNAAGEVAGLVGVLVDITDRKRSEEALQARSVALRALNLELEAQKEQMRAQQQELKAINSELEGARRIAESASRAKSDFLANMSHEIRTPLTAILGYADLLADAAVSPTDRRGHVDTIRRNGEHLLNIINDILDLSKIEAGMMTLEHLNCDLLRLVEDVAALMRGRAADSGLTLDVEYAFPLPTTVRSDPLRLRQILLNLLGNAIKFTHCGNVRLRVRVLRLANGNGRLRCDVIDTGIGMTPEQLRRLFAPFSQADESTTRRFGGTGLGLAISRRLAELLGGEIRVTSKPGVGSHFVVTLDAGSLHNVPWRDAPPAAAPPAATAPPVQLRGRVLLAEDGPDNRRLLSTLLTRAGLTVECAADGRAARDMALAAQAAGRPYDLILMDMQMPELDGYGATRAVRAAGYAGPVLALTAHALAGDRRKSLRAGCDDYLTKPINRQRLLAACARWLAK